MTQADTTHTRTEEIFIIRLADTAARGRCGVCGRETTVAAGLGIALKDDLSPVCSQCVAQNVPPELAKALRLSDVDDATQAVQKARTWTEDDFAIKFNNTHSGAGCPVCRRRHDPQVGLVVTPKDGPIEPVCFECSAKYAPREMTEAVFGRDHHTADARDCSGREATVASRTKRELLAHYCTQEPHQFIRLTVCNDADDQSPSYQLTHALVWELLPSGPEILAYLPPNMRKQEVLLLLGKLTDLVRQTEPSIAVCFGCTATGDSNDIPF